jgi:WD40 repeat protein
MSGWYFGSSEASGRFWDLHERRTLPARGGHPSPVTAVSFTSDGKVGISASDQMVVAWDLTGGGMLHRLPHDTGVSQIIPLPGCACVLTVEYSRAIRRWNLTTGQAELLLPPTSEAAAVQSAGPYFLPVTVVTITPDARRAIAARGDNQIDIWDLDSGNPLGACDGHGSDILAITPLPDNRRFVSSARDGTVFLWDLETGERLHRFKGPRGHVWSLAVSRHGKRLASASDDGAIMLWDLEKLCWVASFVADGPVRVCAFAGDGDYLVAGDGRGRVHFLRIIEP